jgi:hypothetical protein
MSDEFSRRESDLKLSDIMRMISAENDPKERERLFIMLYLANVTAAITKAMEDVTKDVQLLERTLDKYTKVIEQAKSGIRTTKLLFGLVCAVLVFISNTNNVVDDLKSQLSKPVAKAELDMDSTLALQAAQINELRKQLAVISVTK